MTPPDDLSPPRRPIFLPVVIATVFLTIITMTVGFTLGERHRRAPQAAHPEPGASSPADQPSSPEPLPTPSGRPCSETANAESIRQGTGPLALKLRVGTDRGTTAWICVNYRGDLFYEGHSSLGSLFLANVVDEGGNRYHVVDQNGNVFTVSRKVFEFNKVDGDKRTDRVTDHEP